MSVGESFSLLSLSRYFVTKSDQLTPSISPAPNLGLIQPIASGRIENDAANIFDGVTGNYTWYRLSHFAGNPNTQGAELREYLVVFRGLSATSSNPSFNLAIPEGGFTPGFFVYRAMYDQTSATTTGGGTHTWTITFPTNTNIQLNTTATGFNPFNESFFFYVMGI
jgi:hypothetical protein